MAYSCVCVKEGFIALTYASVNSRAADSRCALGQALLEVSGSVEKAAARAWPPYSFTSAFTDKAPLTEQLRLQVQRIEAPHLANEIGAEKSDWHLDMPKCGNAEMPQL